MDFQAPEPKDAFQGDVMAMLGEVYTTQKEMGKRLAQLEKQNVYVKGIAAGFGFLAGLASIVFAKFVPWKG